MQMDIQGQLISCLDVLPEEDERTPGESLLEDALYTWKKLLSETTGLGSLSGPFEAFPSEELSNSLDRVAQLDSDLEIASLTKELMAQLVEFVDFLTRNASFSDLSLAGSWNEVRGNALLSAGTIRQSANRLETAERVVDRSRHALAAAEYSAVAARDAAGMSGDASLAIWFQKYGDREHRASWVFRAIAFAALLVTAWIAWWFFLESESTSFSLGGIVFRAALVLAAAGVATYAIRLAGQHRTQGSWAASIAVQLRSFQAFLDPVAPGVVKDGIYEQFARRVLGAPPERKSTNDELAVGLSAQDIIGLLAKPN